MKKEVTFPLTTEKYKFFQHKDCEFFPCHDHIDDEEFNCLFCYCPLYCLGENCGGNFTLTEDGYKDCTNCLVPHKRDNFDYIIGKYSKIVECFGKVK